jgi:HEAT repeat protein
MNSRTLQVHQVHKMQGVLRVQGVHSVHLVPRVLALAAILLCVVVLPARGQERISNAKLETRSAAQGIEREVQAVAVRGGVAWIGYSVPIAVASRLSFDNNSYGACWLGGWGADGNSKTANELVSRGSRVRLEPPSELLVLARIENGEIVRVRAFTADCDVDAGGAAVVWFTDVGPDDSVAWLAMLADSSRAANRADRVAQSAMSAIAFHRTQAADRTLVAMARDDANRRVRGQALFWLATRASREALSAITGAIENDPDTDVKKKAVFALSQMPKDEGVPRLIDVARTNKNVEVRKQAMFWLGQSNDPRAIRFFEEILLK